MTDLLSEDAPIEGQRYVCLSFITPEKVHSGKINELKTQIKNEEDCEKKCDLYEELISLERMRAVKIRGTFNNEEDAKKHCLFLQKTDPLFDVYLGQVGVWMPWDDSEKTEEKHYAEKELNELMQSHMKNQEIAKEELQKRKTESIKL